MQDGDRGTGARSRWCRLAEKAAVVLLGLLLAAVVLEIGLRIVGATYVQRSRSDDASGDAEYTILCVGDSFTWGAGAPAGETYPRQLQAHLDEREPGRFEVVNRGVGGTNSSQLLETLPGHLIDVEPDLVILMTGSANVWNRYGYRGSSRMSSGGPILRDLLHRIRIYKLVNLSAREFARGRDEARVARVRDGGGETAGARQTATGAPPWRSHGVPGEPGDEGRRFLADGDYDAAVQHYERRIADEAGAAADHVGLGRARLGLGQPRKARQSLYLALDLSPESPDAYLALAEFYEARQELDRAAWWIERAAEIDPVGPHDAVELALYFNERHRYSEALEVLNDAVDAFGEDPRYSQAFVQAYTGEANYEAVAAHLERSIERHPPSAYACNELAGCYLRLGDHTRAIEFGQRCREVEPGNYHCALRLGEVYEAQERFEEALGWYMEAAELSPEWATGSVGRLLAQMGRRAEAIEWYDRAIVLNPEVADLHRASREMLAAELASPNASPPAPSRRPAPDPDASPADEDIPFSKTEWWLVADLNASITTARASGAQVLLQTYPDHSMSRVLRHVATERGLPFVDQEPLFAVLEDPAGYYAPDGHCNARGYGMMATHLVEAVLELADEATGDAGGP